MLNNKKQFYHIYSGVKIGEGIQYKETLEGTYTYINLDKKREQLDRKKSIEHPGVMT